MNGSIAQSEPRPDLKLFPGPPHHGSGTSSSPTFLSRVHPVIDVVSAGAGNPYGHPAPETLARLQDDAVFRTDEDGDITLSTDGTRLWVQTQR